MKNTYTQNLLAAALAVAVSATFAGAQAIKHGGPATSIR
jgi:hypothetical protein